MNTDLPMIESCDGCAACCLVQGAPPDYVALKLNPHFADDLSFAEDVTRLKNLPVEARELLEQYLAQYQQKLIPNNGPCVWLSADSSSCRYYEHRPSTCRIFERSSPGCFYYRRLFALPPT